MVFGVLGGGYWMLYRLEHAGERRQAYARIRLTKFYEQVCACARMLLCSDIVALTRVVVFKIVTLARATSCCVVTPRPTPPQADLPPAPLPSAPRPPPPRSTTPKS